ncbi:hypothetical protein CEXT_83121 [Caerostris extrusa]|uniref:Uncharacterized protein n=1 Tax=Caerostris extrusa TaxID=172846 RepID=A0AAV4SD11_CAEEX|nr:hypothetical protein CEXT_83121 [Caerostris extrusa]
MIITKFHSICWWHPWFEETGCRRKSVGQPGVSAEDVKSVRDAFVCSLQNFKSPHNLAPREGLGRSVSSASQRGQSPGLRPGTARFEQFRGEELFRVLFVKHADKGGVAV